MQLKILMLGWEFPPYSWGGLGTACYGLIKGFSKTDIKINLILPYKHKTNIKNCSISCAKTDLVKFNKYKNNQLKQKIYNNLYTNLSKKITYYAKSCSLLAKQKKFDLIHAHDWLTFKAAIKLKKQTRKPLIVHIHSTEFDRKGEKNIKKEIFNIEKKGMEYADKIITVSLFEKKRIIKYYKINPNKIEVVHNAIVINKKHSKKETIENLSPLKKIQKISEKQSKIILFLGRLTFQKGPEFFIKSAKKILKQKKNVHFVIAGDGDMKNKLKKLSNKLGLNKNITFTGFLKKDKVNWILKKSDIYVMTSIYEPFGIAPLEAMINKTSVIISKNAGVGEIIKNCIKVDYNDTQKISKETIKLLNNETLYKKIIEKGQAEANKINWSTAAEKCKNIYKNLLNTNLICIRKERQINV
ncbi:glycosyltransferase [Candidatus Dependentiae bacterium]|nr:glycosyltransferase [Candidatus Dependentiae bacterium]